MGAELKHLYGASEEVRHAFGRRVEATATLQCFVLECDMLRRACKRSIDVNERAKYLTHIQAIIRYAQHENLPGLDYARIQENIREYRRVGHSATSSRHYYRRSKFKLEIRTH